MSRKLLLSEQGSIPGGKTKPGGHPLQVCAPFPISFLNTVARTCEADRYLHLGQPSPSQSPGHPTQQELPETNLIECKTSAAVGHIFV